jgi:glycogen phosphorylase
MTTSNGPQRAALPKRISGLDPLSRNLWWSWQPHAEQLYRDLDPMLFETLEENPVLLLSAVASARLQEAAADPVYLARYDEAMARFSALITANPTTTWVGEHQPELMERPVAYFSAEFGVHPALPIYSGGLGVLAGDHAKAASDLGLPLVGVSLLYRQGYLRQRLTHDGWQLDITPVLEPGAEPTTPVLGPDGEPLCVEIVLDDPNSPVRLQIWCVQVGRVSLFLLDADV